MDFKKTVLGCLAAILLAGILPACQKKENSQDFDEEVAFWFCARDKHEFKCTFDELEEFQNQEGNYSRPYNCPECGKNDQVRRLPDTDEIKERFKNKEAE